jgi:Transglycosylase SLT domain
MGAALSPGPRLAGVTAALTSAAVLLLAGTVSLIPGLLSGPDCPHGAPASRTAVRSIPAPYLALYQQAAAAYHVPWPVLAAIGAIESDHGRSHATGVRSGVNAFGCCAGPMQFNLRNGPPSTWQSYRVDADGDGATDPYSPPDAIASAAHYLKALLDRAAGDVSAAIVGYNHSQAYVAEVLARARAYARDGDLTVAVPDSTTPTADGDCASSDATDGAPADLRGAQRRNEPRAYAALPEWAMAGGRGPELIDSRLLADALWLLRRYGLRVTAAREAGHNTHGDGTALDLVPANPVDQQAWDASAGALARALGWTRACAASGVRPICGLVPAIQFVGYEGYHGHGSPRACTGSCQAHLHVSWVSPCYGTSVPSEPCRWVSTFEREGVRSSRSRPRH